MNVIAIEDLRKHLTLTGSTLALELGEDHILFHDRSGSGLKTIIALPLTYDELDNASLGNDDGIVLSYNKELLELKLDDISPNDEIIYRIIEPDDLEEFSWELEDFSHSFSNVY